MQGFGSLVPFTYSPFFTRTTSQSVQGRKLQTPPVASQRHDLRALLAKPTSFPGWAECKQRSQGKVQPRDVIQHRPTTPRSRIVLLPWTYIYTIGPWLLHNNNNEYLERLTRTGPKCLHVLYKYIFVKIQCIQHECTHTRTQTHRLAHAHAHTHTHTHTQHSEYVRCSQHSEFLFVRLGGWSWI